MTATRVIRAATRGSALARWQTDHVATLLQALAPGVRVEPVIVETSGDADKTTPLQLIGGKGVFVKEVQAAVLDGRADIAVHSAKDLPSLTPPELTIGAVPRRGDPRDGLVGARLDQLASGATIATGSARRQSQLAHHRPDLMFCDLRGNVPTRLRRVPEGGAVVVAVAALERLGLAHRLVEVLDPSIVLPQVGQGTLAVECRADDAPLLELLGAIDHVPSHRVLDAERAFLATLGGDCAIPAGAHGIITDEREDAPAGKIELAGVLSSLDGSTLLQATRSGSDPVALGAAVASELLACAGGQDLLAVARA